MSAGDHIDDNYEFTPNLHGTSGSAHSVSEQRKGDDAVQKLREVVAEVTRGRIPVQAQRKIGFM